VDGGLIPWLHSTLEMLQTIAYLFLDRMAPKKGILGFSEKQKEIFLASLTILNKETCLSTFSGWGVDHVVALHPKE
jgi:hypothetical protein